MVLEEKRQLILDYLKNHKNATSREIKLNTKLKLYRYFSGGIKEAYKIANLDLPKHLRKRTKYESQKLVIACIKNNPKTANTINIKRDLNISIPKSFGRLKYAYQAANVNYPFKEIEHYKYDKIKKRQDIINFVNGNPNSRYMELQEKFGVKLATIFKNMQEIYDLAGIKRIQGNEKIRARKRLEVINYIKQNPEATQWQINKFCKTHVRDLFENGIIGAFEQANIIYPFERRINYGCMQKEIKHRASKFEDEIFQKLLKVGKVKKHVKTKSGYADALVETKNKKFVVEIKDYRVKNVGGGAIKQLSRYLDDLNLKKGFIICNKSVKDKIYIGNKEIQILAKEDVGLIA